MLSTRSHISIIKFTIKSHPSLNITLKSFYNNKFNARVINTMDGDDDDYDFLFKIVLIGDTCVGKS